MILKIKFHCIVLEISCVFFENYSLMSISWVLDMRQI